MALSFTQSKKGCWTCKDRKIRCDKQVPACRNCIHTGRECLGYGMRLSWPPNTDRRRAIFAKGPGQSESKVPRWLQHQPHFLNVFAADVNLYNSMSESSGSLKYFDANPSIIPNPSWIPIDLDSQSYDLLAYYDVVVSRMVTSANNEPVRNLISRMTFTKSSAAAYAILQITCALTAMKLYGPIEALQFRAKAVEAFNVSLESEWDVKYILQRIVTSLLLALFDLLTSPNVSATWARNVCYAKETAISTYTLDLPYQGDLATILDWTYYHDVFSRFSVRHWRPRGLAVLKCARNRQLAQKQMNAPNKILILGASKCSLEVLMTLGRIFDFCLDYEGCQNLPMDVVDMLERRLKFAHQELRMSDVALVVHTPEEQEIRSIAELYRLAGLIYLHRAIRKTPTWGPAFGDLVDSAYAVIANLKACDRTFPLFIIACEARTDLRRAQILKILDASRDDLGAGIFSRVEQYIERFWAQEDLDTAQEFDYMAKMDAIQSGAPSLPAWT